MCFCWGEIPIYLNLCIYKKTLSLRRVTRMLNLFKCISKHGYSQNFLILNGIRVHIQQGRSILVLFSKPFSMIWTAKMYPFIIDKNYVPNHVFWTIFCRINEKTRRTLSLCTGMQSSTLAGLLATQFLGGSQAVPPACSVVVMAVMGLSLASFWGNGNSLSMLLRGSGERPTLKTQEHTWWVNEPLFRKPPTTPYILTIL